MDTRMLGLMLKECLKYNNTGGKMNTENYQQYLQLVQCAFSPNAGHIINESKNKRVYVELNSIDQVIGGLTLMEHDEGIGIIMYMCGGDKSVGGKLLEQLDSDYNGLITVRTNKDEKFYLQHGYKTIGKNDTHAFMVKWVGDIKI